jgi:hypothetical protein
VTCVNFQPELLLLASEMTVHAFCNCTEERIFRTFKFSYSNGTQILSVGNCQKCLSRVTVGLAGQTQ